MKALWRDHWPTVLLVLGIGWSILAANVCANALDPRADALRAQHAANERLLGEPQLRRNQP